MITFVTVKLKNNKHDYHKLFYCKTGKKSTKIITFVTVKLKKQQT